jgi:hypothetical protein
MSSTTTTIESLYVVDTNALIWYLTKDKKLGKQALQIIEAAERGETQLILSAISMAEMYFANAKHGWFADFAQTCHDLMSSPHFQFEAFNVEDVLRFTADAYCEFDSRDSFLLQFQPVSDTRLGDQVLGAGRIGFDLVAQLAHINTEVMSLIYI